MQKRSLIHKLFEIEAIRFGEFLLKSGQISPFYIDLRRAFSYPKVLSQMAEAMFSKVRDRSFDLICGVPYAAIPMATAISIEHTLPLIFLRKEAKNYGTKKLIEGVYQPGERVLLIEDVITTGKSILESIPPLQEEGLIVEEIIVFADRGQKGIENLTKAGFKAQAFCHIHQLVEALLEEGIIEDTTAKKVDLFLRESNELV